MKKDRKMLLKTKRLNIYPLSDPEIEELIDQCQDAGLAEAYKQMLEGCRNHPEQRFWYAPWTLETKKEKMRIGEVGFKGPDSNYSVEIGYGIKKEYEGQGYTTEAVEALVDWAIDNEEVLFVEAEADINNAASIHILAKLGFREYGQGVEGPRFVKSKPETYYTSIGMCLGMCFGISIGMTVFHNMVIGMCIGMTIGLSLGASKDKRNKARITEIEQEKYKFNVDEK